jgi:hypothetical protein
MSEDDLSTKQKLRDFQFYAKRRLKRIYSKISLISPKLAGFMIKHFRPQYRVFQDVWNELERTFGIDKRGSIEKFFGNWLDRHDRRYFDPEAIRAISQGFIEDARPDQYDENTKESIIDETMKTERIRNEWKAKKKRVRKKKTTKRRKSK